jgi:hypothetical protein
MAVGSPGTTFALRRYEGQSNPRRADRSADRMAGAGLRVSGIDTRRLPSSAGPQFDLRPVRHHANPADAVGVAATEYQMIKTVLAIVALSSLALTLRGRAFPSCADETGQDQQSHCDQQGAVAIAACVGQKR